MKWIVVGAGSGGCVAARRLHDAGHDVVVVEAGPSLDPGVVPTAIDGPDAFAALGEPERSHRDLVARRTRGGAFTPYLRGRGVGGSSVINAMVALDGDLALYRSWGWDDADRMRERILVPTEIAGPDELGRTDRLLIAAHEQSQPVELTRAAGRRVTAAESYLWPIAASSRCSIVSDTTVDRVLVDRDGRAAGVLTSSGASIDADCVVLAAGAIHSPAILLRSGLGNDEVGRGLSDHPAAVITLRYAPEHAVSAAPGLATGSHLDLDPIQILPLNHLGSQASGDLGALMVALMRPVSRSGRVTLVSDDPLVHPLVEFEMLEDPADLATLRKGVQLVLSLIAAEPFASAVSAAYIDDAGTSVDRLDSDEAIDTWLGRHSADYVHASGSCAGAIDAQGAVTGCERVFVCDASAFPSIPNANTHIPTMMLAERLAARWTHTAD